MLAFDQILERLRRRSDDPAALSIDPPPADIAPHGSLDLHLSGHMLLFRGRTRQAEEVEREKVSLYPGELGLATTLQHVRLPADLTGEVVGRSVWGRRGMLIASTGALDPLFSGRITLELQNLGDVELVLTRGVAVGQLLLHQTSSKPRPRPPFGRLSTALVVSPDGAVALFQPTKVVKLAELNTLAEPWLENREVNERAEVIQELESMIRRSGVSESQLQRFIEHHSWVLLGDEYVDIRPQVVLQRSGLGTLRPDFFLKPVVGESWDILDLKLPKVAPLIVGRADRRTYSHKVASGIAQLRRYGQYFNDAVNRNWVETKYGIFAYRPRLLLLIGRRFENDLRELRQDVRKSTEVEVITYEELITCLQHRTRRSV